MAVLSILPAFSKPPALRYEILSLNTNGWIRPNSSAEGEEKEGWEIPAQITGRNKGKMIHRCPFLIAVPGGHCFFKKEKNCRMGPGKSQDMNNGGGFAQQRKGSYL